MRRSREGPAAEVMKGSSTRPHPPPGQCDWLLQGGKQEPLGAMPRHRSSIILVVFAMNHSLHTPFGHFISSNI